MDPNLIFNLGVPALVIGSMAWRKVIKPYLMSSAEGVPDDAQSDSSQRSYAVERSREPSGTAGGNIVPDLVERLGTLDDDDVLDILSRLKDEAGEYRYAESRIAKFIPGRVEDRLAQVRAARGTEAPPPVVVRELRVRDTDGERAIPFATRSGYVETEPGLRYEPPPR